MIVDLGVEDFGYLELRFSIDNYGRWQRLGTGRNDVGSHRLQHGDMKYWVDHSH